MDQQIIHKPNPNTLLLIDRLRQCALGELATWDELSALIGLDVREEGRGFLATARRRLVNDDGIVFGNVRGVGLKRLNDEEIATVQMDWRRRKIRRQANFTAQEGMCANLSNLTPEAQRNLTVALETAGRVRHFTNLKFVEEEKTRVELNPPPPRPPLIDG